MGADYVQYMVADGVSAPPSSANHFSEKLILMPYQLLPANHRHLHNSSSPLRHGLPPRAKYDLPDDTFVFCSFNTPYKLDPITFGTWLAILRYGGAWSALVTPGYAFRNLRGYSNDGIE
eukprot:6034887-Pyramimonas_sp.AAC.3